MIKLVIIGVFVVLAGSAGYFGEQYFRPTTAPAPDHADKAESAPLLFKMPLGKFTLQVIQPRSNLHIVFDIDVYVMGASAFEAINGAAGRARMRDATIGVLSELAEVDQRILSMQDDAEMKKALAEEIVRRLYPQFPLVRSARINKTVRNITPKG